MKENCSNKSFYSRLIPWVDCLLPFQFDIENIPGAKTDSVDYCSRHPNQKAKKVSAFDEEFIVAKLKLISASVNSLNLKSSEPAFQLSRLIQAHDPAHQITLQTEAIDMAISLFGIHAAGVHKHDYYISPATRKQATNINSNLGISKYAYTASQMPINTSIARQNTT